MQRSTVKKTDDGLLVLLVFGFGPAVESLVGPSATDPLFIGGLLVILAVGIIYAGWRLILR